MRAKVYDRAYFDAWYRESAERVGSRAALRRKVAAAIALAEYYLGRPVRSVLDVGCGEAPWRAHLRALRPGVRYLGLDASDYVVSRYGRTRDIRLATFGQLGELRFDRRFDLIVCSDVLHYLSNAEIRRGLSGFADLLDGLAFIEVFTAEDRATGDRRGFVARKADWYRAEFRRAGLTACGTHGYLSPRLVDSFAALEVLPPRAR